MCRLVESFGGGFEDPFCAFAFFVEGVLDGAWRVLRPCSCLILSSLYGCRVSRLMTRAFSPESTQGKRMQAMKIVLRKIRSHIFPAVRLLAVLLHRCFKGAFFMGLQNAGNFLLGGRLAPVSTGCFFDKFYRIGFMGSVNLIPQSNDRLGVMNQAALISSED